MYKCNKKINKINIHETTTITKGMLNNTAICKIHSLTKDNVIRVSHDNNPSSKVETIIQNNILGYYIQRYAVACWKEHWVKNQSIKFIEALLIFIITYLHRCFKDSVNIQGFLETIFQHRLQLLLLMCLITYFEQHRRPKSTRTA